MLAFDSETHLIQPGLLSPPLVCSSWAEKHDTGFTAKPQTLAWVRRVLAGTEQIAGANIAYDFAVLGAEDPALVDLIFQAYTDGRIFDVQIAQALDAIAGGHLFADPATHMPLRNPTTNEVARYSLEICSMLMLGRYNVKENDDWVLRYHELESVPLAEWPREAVQYPQDDARNTWDVAATQQGVIGPRRHVWSKSVSSEWDAFLEEYPTTLGLCTLCGADPKNMTTWGDCPNGERKSLRNLGYLIAPALKEPMTHMTHQARAALALQLACVWGMRTNREAVETLERKTLGEHRIAVERFTEVGIIRPDGSEDQAFKKKLVITAYGGRDPCRTCTGSGKVQTASCPKVKCKACKGGGLLIREGKAVEGVACPVEGCVSGKVPGKRSKNMINCKACGGAGLAYPEGLPLTDTGAASTDRDTLAESGDVTLEEYADVSRIDKVLETYIPMLKKAIDLPFNARGNVLVDSARTSYEGLLQQMPRDGGLRDCFQAREGYWYCSTDYAAIELVTLAQQCLWIVGESKMAEVINETKDPGALHTRLGARIAGVPYEEFLLQRKSKDAEVKALADMYRGLGKKGNFGYPGGMGAAKFVLALRKEGTHLCVSTKRAPPCKIAGFACKDKKCRSCHGRGAICGVEKVFTYKKKPITPTCTECIKVAEEIREAWFETWPEIKPYFSWVNGIVGESHGQGVIETPGTGMFRGGLSFTNGANHGFQHLAAAGGKHAFFHVSKECYTDRASPLWGTRPIIFVHDETLSETPIKMAPWAGPRQAQIMVERMREFVPDVHVVCEPALSKTWTKKAEPVYDMNGLLTVWEPERKAA